MKKYYTKPELDINAISCSNVVTTSVDSFVKDRYDDSWWEEN